MFFLADGRLEQKRFISLKSYNMFYSSIGLSSSDAEIIYHVICEPIASVPLIPVNSGTKP